MWERGELFLPALVVSESLKLPESVEVPGQGTAPASTAHITSVTQICEWCQCCADTLKCGCSSRGIQDFTCGWNQSVQPGHGGRGSTERGSCVGVVLSSGNSSHSVGSAVVLLLNQISWAVGGKGKWGNACVSGGWHLQGCCALPGGCWQCICSTKTGSKGGYK